MELQKGKKGRTSSPSNHGTGMSEIVCSIILVTFLSSVFLQMNDFALSMMPGPRVFRKFKHLNNEEKNCFNKIRNLNQNRILPDEHTYLLRRCRDHKVIPDQLHLRFESKFALPMNSTNEDIHGIINVAETSILDRGILHYEAGLELLNT